MSANLDDAPRTGSELGISLFASISAGQVGDALLYSVRVFNGALDSGSTASDASGIQAYIITPDGKTNIVSLVRTTLHNSESDFYPHVVSYIVRAEDVHADGTLLATARGIWVTHQNDPDEAFLKQAETRTVLRKQLALILPAINAKLLDYVRLNPLRLYQLTSRQFEQVIAEIFDGLGFRIELTQQTRDGGRDIIAIRERVIREKYLIECKRYSRGRPIGVGHVRALLGVVHSEGATKGILATTSHFTGPSKDFLEDNEWQLEGCDFDKLLNWLEILGQLLERPPASRLPSVWK